MKKQPDGKLKKKKRKKTGADELKGPEIKIGLPPFPLPFCLLSPFQLFYYKREDGGYGPDVRTPDKNRYTKLEHGTFASSPLSFLKILMTL